MPIFLKNPLDKPENNVTIKLKGEKTCFVGLENLFFRNNIWEKGLRKSNPFYVPRLLFGIVAATRLIFAASASYFNAV